jgi:tetratricopeptide (TPR) repeat protein
MKGFLLISFLSFFLLGSYAQDSNAILKDAERLESIPDEKSAFNKFKEALKLMPSNIYVLSKCSELCSRIGAREKNTKTRDSYYAAAVIYAKNALKIAPNNDEANVAMAIAVGRTVLVKSGKEKISAVKDIKRYADNALKVNSQNFKAWHVLGKWNYEVSNLNMMERAATKVFYGGLPDASLKGSIHAYEKAKSLNPNFMLNYLELAKAYNRNDERPKAISQLKILLTLPMKTEDDPRIKAEATKLLQQWS